MMHFRDIPLGRASAELEGAYNPDLIVKGFLDPWNVLDKAKNGPEFLFLGYKGSGKSAIGEHLRLTATDDYSLFVSHTFLSDFPYGNFSRIVTGDAEPESRFPTAWQWILVLRLLDSISKDNGIEEDDFGQLHMSLKALRSAGLLTSDDLKHMVVASSRAKYKAKLLGVLEIEFDPNEKKSSELQFLQAITYLRDLLLTVKSNNKHFLILDGLDDILYAKHDTIQIYRGTNSGSCQVESNVRTTRCSVQDNRIVPNRAVRAVTWSQQKQGPAGFLRGTGLVS